MFKEAIRKQKEREERIRLEFERRMNPKTKEDFDLLYAALESKCLFHITIFVLYFVQNFVRIHLKQMCIRSSRKVTTCIFSLPSDPIKSTSV